MATIPLLAAHVPNNATSGSGNITPRALASLYVGDLQPEATEAVLYEKFSPIGPVTSIRVCRDAITRCSLGYAYVNFQNPIDAERAMDTLNFENVMGKPIRIMWSQRDPSARRSGIGNIFIKNLDKSIDAKSLHDTFSLFGTILSCKVSLDAKGESRGYGFIQFDSEESATKAISKVNGMLLDNKKVNACKFQPRSVRYNSNESGLHYKNIYVKNFSDLWDKEKLESFFSQFGKITSSAIMAENGKSKGFGFVAFENAEAAQKAAQEMNDYEVEPGKKLTVCRAQSKAERSKELKNRYDSSMQKFVLGNLYVKQLDESVDDAKLYESFEKFGKIISAKVMKDENDRSKGFGFVCFERAEDAKNAHTEMHGKFLSNKPIYVAPAQRKDERRALLNNAYMQRLGRLRMQGQAVGSFPGNMYPQASYFMPPNGIQNQRVADMYQQAYTFPWSMSAGNVPMQMRVGGMSTNQYRFGPRYPNRRNNHYNQSGGRSMRAQQPRMEKPQAPIGMPSKSAAPEQGQAFVTEHELNPVTNEVGVKDMLSRIVNEAPLEQKQLIGEFLFPRVQKCCPERYACKITGMILEMDNAELINLLENHDSLKMKVEEALDVLERSVNNLS